MIYFDHQSTTPADSRVIDAMLPFFREHFGNPQARFVSGDQPRDAIKKARKAVADLINADESEIIFTANGSESNNLAIKGLARALHKKGKHIITSQIEHSSVLKSLKSLEKDGYEISCISVDSFGLINLAELEKTIRDDTIFAVFIHSSNEIGTIEPVEKIARILQNRSVLFICDGVQTVGNIPVDVRRLAVDLMSLAGHQFYGPKGAAALFVRKGVKIYPQIEGGIQENSRRAGTENVPGIVGIGKAAELARLEMADRIKQVSKLGNELIAGIKEKVTNVHLIGHPTERLPGHVSFCFEYVEGESMLLLLSAAGIEGASGSTCSSHQLKTSHVLLAIGVGDLLAQGSMLFSLGKENSKKEVDCFLEKLPPIVERLREMSPVDENFKYDKKSFNRAINH